MLGLLLFGWGIALMVAAELGLAPWGVFHQGISVRTGIPIGTVGILTGLLVLTLWRPLGERYGIGTVSNVILIGIVIDLTLWALPDLTSTPLRWAALLSGLLLIGIASGLYIVFREGRGRSANAPVLATRSRAETGTAPRISQLLRRPGRDGGDAAD